MDPVHFQFLKDLLALLERYQADIHYDPVIDVLVSEFSGKDGPSWFNVDDLRLATKLEEIQLLAREVMARTMVRGFIADDGFSSDPPMRNLQLALKDSHPCLARAVNAGDGWVRDILTAHHYHCLKDVEDHASGPGWSWNTNWHTQRGTIS